MKTTLFSLLFSVSIVFATPPKGIKLQLNLEKGKTYKTETIMDMTSFKDDSFEEEVFKMNTDVIMEYKAVEKAANGDHTIEATITSMKAIQRMQGMEIYYDSSDPETAQGMGAMIAEQFEPIIDKTVTFKVDKNGKMIEAPVEVEGTQFSITDMVKDLFSSLPDREFSHGDSWKQEQGGANSPAIMNVTYTVDDISKKQVVLSFKAGKEDVMINEDQAAEIDEMEMKMQGTITFDRDSGRVLRSGHSQTTSGSSPQQGEFFMVTTVTQKVPGS